MGGIVGRPLRGRTRRALVYVALLAACRSDSTGPGVTQLVFSAQPSGVTAGVTITPPIKVTALDANGNTATRFTGGVTIVFGTNPSGGALSGTTTVAAISGVATFANLSIDKSGAGYTFQATSGGLTSSPSATITVTPAVATQLSFTVQPSNTGAGATIAPAVQVTARDAFGNLATSYAGVVSLAIATNPSGGTLSGTTSQSTTAGVAGFSGLSIDKAGTGYTLMASSIPLTAATSTGFRITAGSVSASQSTMIATPDSLTAGSAVSTIAIIAKDAIGNPIQGATVVLSASGTGNTLSQPGATTDANGAASGTLSSTVAESKIVSAVVNGVGLTQTAMVTVIPAAGSALVFTGQPSTVGAGATIPTVQVTAHDQFGNTATSYAGLVTVELGTNPGGGALSGSATQAAAAGVATFSDLSIDKAGTGYSLTASGAGLSAGSSTAFNITVGNVSASQSTVSALPTGITASNGSNTSTITVVAKDAFGNPIPGATAVLSATGLGNTLIQPVGTTNASGVVTGTLSSTMAEPKTVSATIDGVGITQTVAVLVNPAAASGLVFTSQPSSTGAGATMTPAVEVTAVDQFGNTVSGFTTNVIVAIGTNPSGGTLAGTTSRPAVSGVASFTDLSVDKAGTGYTLTATSGGLNQASIAFNISAGGPDHLAITVPPSNTTAGASITPSIQVEIRDQFDNLVGGATNTVTLAIDANPGGGTLSGTTTQNAVGGVATFFALSIDRAGSGYTLRASASGLTPQTSGAFTIAPGEASELAFTVAPSGATAGAAISPPVAVEMLDPLGNRVTTAGNSVTVAILDNPGSGTLSGTTVVDALSGVATFSTLSIDKAGSGYTLRATSTGLTAVTSASFDITAGLADHLAFSVDPSHTTATETITPAVRVEIRDQFDNLVTGASTSVTTAIASNPGGGSLSGTTTRAAVAGVATFPGLSIDKVGTGYTLGATATGLTSATSSAFNITVGGAAKLGFVHQPTQTSGGATISPAVTVEVQDAGGNRVPGATNSVTLAIGVNPGPGAALTGTNPVSAVNGLATFSNLSIDSAGTGYTLVATSGGLTQATSSTFNITVGAAAKLGFVQQPTSTSGGATISPPITVEVQDAGGNRVGTATNLIGIAILNNPGSGTLAGDNSNNAVSGLATFNTLSINNAGTGYTLRATATGLTSATSSAFNITVGGAAKLGFVQQPTQTSGGATISPAVTVEVQDAGGNRVTGATNSVTLAIGVNPEPGAALSGTNPVSAVNGLATFSNLSIDSAGTGYTLVATSGGLTQATSSTFNITVGAAAKLGFVQQPTQSSGGVTITPAITVAVQDLGGNRVTGATNSIAIAILSGGGSLSGTTPRSAVSGLATFDDLSIDLAGNGYTLRATTSGLTGVTSNAFNIIVGPPAKLVYLQQPTSATAGAAIAPAITVRLLDAGNNLVTTATNPVDIAILNNAGPGGVLSGTTQRNAVSGVATFNNLSVDKTGTGYTLMATSGSLTSATSAGFNITAAAVDAVQSSVLAADDTMGQCLSTCLTASNGAVAITVTARDQFGNVVPSAPVALTASPVSADSNRFTNPGAAGTTDASGVFVANFNSAQALLNKAVSATVGGTVISQTATIAVMPVLVGAGDIAECGARVSDDSTARLLDSIPGTVFAVGDNAYPNGRTQDYANCYDPTWGRHKARTRPVTGNHEYDSSATAAPYLAYFGASVADPLNNGGYYYSYDLGAWHIVVLNTDILIPAQVAWLQTDLAGRSNQCILALWHRPIFTSGSSGGRLSARPLWQALQDAGAEIVINGHDHLYERFALQDSLGNADPTGIREFIVGTGGGETHSNFISSPLNVEASDAGNFSRGVIRLTLYAGSYRWQFIPALGFGTFTDSGIQACH